VFYIIIFFLTRCSIIILTIIIIIIIVVAITGAVFPDHVLRTYVGMCYTYIGTNVYLVLMYTTAVPCIILHYIRRRIRIVSIINDDHYNNIVYFCIVV